MVLTRSGSADGRVETPPALAEGPHAGSEGLRLFDSPDRVREDDLALLRADQARTQAQLDDIAASLRALIGVPPPSLAGGGVFLKEETSEKATPLSRTASPTSPGDLPGDVVAFLGRRGEERPVIRRLCRAFRSLQPSSILSWPTLREAGLIPPHASGWEMFIPHGAFTAADALLPWWVATEGRSLDTRSAERLWPILVEKRPDAATILKGPRPPAAYCDKLEIYARTFMEAAAASGPSAVAPQRYQESTPEKEWHTEESLVAKAVEGLSYHGAISKVLQHGTPPATLGSLFKLAAQLLRIDVEEVLVSASQSLGRLSLQARTREGLLELRASFAAIASILGDRLGRGGLRQAFMDACLRNSGTPESMHRFLLNKGADVGNWEDLWTLLFHAVQDATWTSDLSSHHAAGHSSYRTSRDAVGARPAPQPIRLQHLDPVQDNNEVGHDDGDESEGEESALNLLDLRQVVDGCFLCGESEHRAADCPHKEAASVSIPSERLRDLLGAARAHARRTLRARATGQEGPIRTRFGGAPRQPPNVLATLSLAHLAGNASALPTFWARASMPGSTVSEMVHTLDDTGAADNFISEDLALRLGFDPRGSEPGPLVSMGNSARVRSQGFMAVKLTMSPARPDLTVTVQVQVLPGLAYPLILGWNFSRSLRKKADYEAEALEWTFPGPTVVRTPLLCSILTDAQARSALEGAAEVFCCTVNEVDEHSPSPPRPRVFTTTGPDPTAEHGAEDIETDKSIAEQESDFAALVGRSPPRLAGLLQTWKHIFVRPPGPIVPPSHGVEATIPTVPGQTAFTRQFPLPESHLRELRGMMDELLAKGWVEPQAHSPHNNPIFLVQKPGGKGWRVVLDFRRLNSITTKDKYRLPRTDDLLRRLAQHRLISTMDLPDSFFQIPLRVEDRDKTSFSTPWGTLRWTRMPMGLCNAPSCFQGLTDQVTQDLPHAVGYIDDLGTGGQTEEEHDKNLEEVFARVASFGLMLKAKKCIFSQTEIKFLGHRVSYGQIAACVDKVEALRQLESPATQKEVRSFLGMLNYHARFIKGYHGIAAPLERLCGTVDRAPDWRTRCWTDSCEAAFQRLRQAMTEAPVLVVPDFDRTATHPFVLATDASGFGMGACLMQADPEDSKPRPIGYWSRAFTPLEQRMLATHERELCAVMEGLEHFRCTVLGYPLEVWCDHRPLEHLMTQPTISAKMGRWVHRIAEYRFKFVYRPGTSPEMLLADGLSRRDGPSRTPLRPLDEVCPEVASRIREAKVPAATGPPTPLATLTPCGPQAKYALLLCSGSSGTLERYLRSRGDYVVITLDADPANCPVLCGDVADWRDLVARVLPPGTPLDIIWASPPCTAFSVARRTGGAADVGEALSRALACMEAIEALKPRVWVLENPASGSAALHLQDSMQRYESRRRETSYCHFGAHYRKVTSLWTNLPVHLPGPCTKSRPCKVRIRHGCHPLTAQAGPHPGQLGMGSGPAVWGYPTALLQALLDDAIPGGPGGVVEDPTSGPQLAGVSPEEENLPTEGSLTRSAVSTLCTMIGAPAPTAVSPVPSEADRGPVRAPVADPEVDDGPRYLLVAGVKVRVLSHDPQPHYVVESIARAVADLPEDDPMLPALKEELRKTYHRLLAWDQMVEPEQHTRLPLREGLGPSDGTSGVTPVSPAAARVDTAAQDRLRYPLPTVSDWNFEIVSDTVAWVNRRKAERAEVAFGSAAAKRQRIQAPHPEGEEEGSPKNPPQGFVSALHAMTGEVAAGSRRSERSRLRAQQGPGSLPLDSTGASGRASGTPNVTQLVQDAPSDQVALPEPTVNVQDPPLVIEIKRALARDAMWLWITSEEEIGGRAILSDKDREDYLRFEIVDGLLRLKEDGRVYIPSSPFLIDLVVNEVHAVGHFGRDKCYELISKSCWWPSMRQDIAARCTRCSTCAAHKTKRLKRLGELHPLPAASKPWQSVSIDFVTGLPKVHLRNEEGRFSYAACDGNSNCPVVVDSIFVMTCRYSKAVRIRACNKHNTHKHVIDMLTEDLFRTFGWPENIVSDNDIRFSEGYRTFLQESGIELHMTSGYHPQANGQAERSNSTVLNVLRTLSNGMPLGWPHALPHVEYAINSTPASHGFTPFSCYLHFPPRDPLSSTLGSVSSRQAWQGSQFDRADGHPVLPPSEIHDMVRRRLEDHRVVMKACYDRRSRPVTLQAGDRVYLMRKVVTMGRKLRGEEDEGTRKLRAPYLGPFMVERAKTHAPNTYVLDVRPFTFGDTWHVSHLVPVPREWDVTDTAGYDRAHTFRVEAILARARHGNAHQYLVKWAGISTPTWELPEEIVAEVAGGRDMFHRFRKKFDYTEEDVEVEEGLREARPEWFANMGGVE